MNKNRNIYLWGAGILIVFIVGIVAFSGGVSSTPSAEGAKLTLSETKWDLGDVAMSKGVESREVQMTNDGKAPVTITRMETSCMCTTAQIIHENGESSGVKGMVGHGGTPALSEVVAPGETVTVLVKYDPNAHGPYATGPTQRTVSLFTNSKTQPPLKLALSGNVGK